MVDEGSLEFKEMGGCVPRARFYPKFVVSRLSCPNPVRPTTPLSNIAPYLPPLHATLVRAAKPRFNFAHGHASPHLAPSMDLFGVFPQHDWHEQVLQRQKNVVQLVSIRVRRAGVNPQIKALSTARPLVSCFLDLFVRAFEVSSIKVVFGALGAKMYCIQSLGSPTRRRPISPCPAPLGPAQICLVRPAAERRQAPHNQWCILVLDSTDKFDSSGAGDLVEYILKLSCLEILKKTFLIHLLFYIMRITLLRMLKKQLTF